MAITKAAIEFEYTMTHKMAEDAVVSGNLDVLNNLLRERNQTSKKLLIESVTFQENCLLQLAAQNGHLAIVNRLLQIPYVVKDAAAKNNAALCGAIENGQLAIVNRLLKIPSVLEKMISESSKTLRLAVQSGSLEILNCVLDFPGMLEGLDACDNSILKLAIENKHFDVAKRLLEIPIIQMKDAASRGDLKELKQLMEHEVLLPSMTIYTLLLIAVKKGHLTIVNYLFEFPECVDKISDIEILVEAASGGHVNIVNRLLELPCILAKLEAESVSVLCAAVRSGNLDLLNLLLEIPAVLKSAAIGFSTAIESSDRLHMVNRFLEIKEIADSVASSGSTIDTVAYLESDNFLIFERLLQIPGVKDKCSLRTVNQACYWGSVEKLNRLLEIPHVLEAVKQEGVVESLRYAAKRHYAAIIGRLFQIPEVFDKTIGGFQGALVLAVDGNDLTLLNRVLQESSPSQIAAILKKEMENDNFALQRAAEIGNLAIVNRLLMVDSIRELFICKMAHDAFKELFERLPTVSSLRTQFIPDQVKKSFHEGALRTAVTNRNLPIVNRLCQVLLENGVALPSKMTMIIAGVKESLQTFNSKIDSIIVSLSSELFPGTSLVKGIMSLILGYADLPEGNLKELCALKGESLRPVSLLLSRATEQQSATLIFSGPETGTRLGLSGAIALRPAAVASETAQTAQSSSIDEAAATAASKKKFS